MRVKKVQGGQTTVYIGALYEKNVSTGVATSYYFAGGQRIAVRELTATTDKLYYLHSDHLGSTSLTTDNSGNRVGEVKYYPFGETRYSWGSTPTDRRYTGQREESALGSLYDYGARMYSPYLNRWLSPDTIVPDPKNPQSLNRYAYTLNNPVKYTDPTGHDVDCGLGESGCKKQPKKPPIVPRSEWGAMPPGYVYCIPGYCSIAGFAEGFYDPDRNPDGYAAYSDLYPELSLADVLNTVVVHHEGNNQTYSVNAVQQKHMYGEGWIDIGYHYVIGPDGTIYEGRDIAVRGSHVLANNSGKIGVLLLGDFEPGSSWRGIIFPDNDDLGPTELQVQSMIALVRWLDYNYGVERVLGHRDLNDTECPGAYCLPYIPIFNQITQER